MKERQIQLFSVASGVAALFFSVKVRILQLGSSDGRMEEWRDGWRLRALIQQDSYYCVVLSWGEPETSQ